MSYQELEKNFADLKVNLDWGPYIFPFHSIKLCESLAKDCIGCLDCKMVLRDKSIYQETYTIPAVLTPEAIHEVIGKIVKRAIEHLIQWNRLPDAGAKDLIE